MPAGRTRIAANAFDLPLEAEEALPLALFGTWIQILATADRRERQIRGHTAALCEVLQEQRDAADSSVHMGR